LKKGLSIITNFGCDTGCEYCIWKLHKLNSILTKFNSTDWNSLYRYLKQNSTKKISISGGGDPFYKYNDNRDWYWILFKICKKLNIKIDVHTSKIILNNVFLSKFNKIVLHLNPEDFLIHVNDLLLIPNKKRLVFVINNDLTIDFVNFVNKFCKTNKIQLSFRELYGFDISEEAKRVQNYIIENESKSFYKFIKQDDYNIYFMPNNEFVEKFIG